MPLPKALNIILKLGLSIVKQSHVHVIVRKCLLRTNHLSKYDCIILDTMDTVKLDTVPI